MDENDNATEVPNLIEQQPGAIVAVTGGSGLIGRHVVQVLAQAGFRLRLLTRGPATDRAGVEWVRGDLLSAASLRELVRGAAAVVHLAGVAHTTLDSAAEREAAYETNAGGTRSLVQASTEAEVPAFVLMSSAHVYEGQRGIALRESSPTAGDSPYAQMKLEAEAAVLEMAAKTPSRTVVLRPCLVYGPGARFNLHSLIGAVSRGLYVHPGNLPVERSLASVDTVAATVLHVLNEASCQGIFNVADRHPVQLREWVDELADRMKVRRPRTVPLGLLRLAAAAGSAAKAVGLPAPLTRDSLAKLTESFSLDVSRLAATGFVWPQTGPSILQQMIELARAH